LIVANLLANVLGIKWAYDSKSRNLDVAIEHLRIFHKAVKLSDASRNNLGMALHTWDRLSETPLRESMIGVLGRKRRIERVFEERHQGEPAP
jgi:hypothetical protein